MTLWKLLENNQGWSAKVTWKSLCKIDAVPPLLLAFVRDGSIFFALCVGFPDLVQFVTHPASQSIWSAFLSFFRALLTEVLILPKYPPVTCFLGFIAPFIAHGPVEGAFLPYVHMLIVHAEVLIDLIARWTVALYSYSVWAGFTGL